MITITEKRAEKLPCYSSLFFELSGKAMALRDEFAQTQGILYNMKTGLFEALVKKLYYIVNRLTEICDVEVKVLQENPKAVVGYKPAKNSAVKLYKHQIAGVEYGLSHGGWLLLDEPGLGKTLQILCIAEELRKKKEISHCFIICGINGLKYNWEQEIAKYTKTSCCILGQRVTKTGKRVIGTVAQRCAQLKAGVKEFYVITNIETLQNKAFLEAFRKSKSGFGMIVLDEAQCCKSPTSLSAKTLLKMQSPHNAALTGTLLVNNPEDAYVALKWTGNTGSTFTQFKTTYNVYGGFGGVQVIGHQNLEVLQELLQSCSLRRRKEDALDLPQKTYMTEYVEMGREQQKLYAEVEAGITEQLDKLDHKPTVMEEITINMRLRQITAYPGSISTEVTSSAKLDRMEELVDGLVAQGNKVVVMGTFRSAVQEAHRRLERYCPVLCTGGSTDEQIEASKRAFEHDDKCKVFVATWQKMGVGHTLTAANYLIFLDTPWTAASFEQAADRIHRIGQHKPVFIITLITKDTYDERVQEIVTGKAALAGAVIDDGDLEEVNNFG